MTILIPDSLALPRAESAAFSAFLQKMANRAAAGHARYDAIDATKGYMTRLAKELAAYRRAGNIEQLLNIAVYSFLESYAPENQKAHFDNAARSVTRRGR